MRMKLELTKDRVKLMSQRNNIYSKKKYIKPIKRDNNPLQKMMIW